MAEIDNTLAAQVPQFNLATTLQQGAQAQAMQAQAQEAQFKQRQNAVGAEMRGVAPFVNTPEFPQRWAQAADKLLSDGVIDPQTHQQIVNSPSPLMLKSIIAKTEDPQLTLQKQNADQAKINADRNYGLAANADRRAAAAANDETPEGFETNPAFKTDQTQPRFRPLSGGPQDPNYLTAVELAKAKAPKIVAEGSSVVVPATGEVKYENRNTAGIIPDETADFAAERILLGEKGVKTGYGRGAQGPENIAKIDAAVARKAKERNISPGELVQRGIDLVGDTSRERTAATQEGRMSSAGIEAQGAIKLGKEASDSVPRTSWVPVNKAIQAYQSNTSDPNLKKFGAANLTIINTYARAINPNGVGTVADKEHAAEMLKTADGPEAYNAVLDQLNKEIEMAHKSPAQARAGFRQERSGRYGADKPSPDARFKQLIGTGLSKDDAYAKMHEEGY